MHFISFQITQTRWRYVSQMELYFDLVNLILNEFSIDAVNHFPNIAFWFAYIAICSLNFRSLSDFCLRADSCLRLCLDPFLLRLCYFCNCYFGVSSSIFLSFSWKGFKKSRVANTWKQMPHNPTMDIRSGLGLSSGFKQ